MGWAGDLRRELSARNQQIAITNGSLHELTAGEAPSGIFGCNEQNRRSADGLMMRGAEWWNGDDTTNRPVVWMARTHLAPAPAVPYHRSRPLGIACQRSRRNHT